MLPASGEESRQAKSAETRLWMVSGLAAAIFIGGFILLALIAMLAAGDSPLSLPLSAYLLSILRFTLWQAFLSTLLSVMLAVPVALALARRQAFWGRRLVVQLMALPLGLPVLTGAFAIIEIWGRGGLINRLGLASGVIDQPISIYGLSGILLAHVFFNMPLAARLMLQALERIPGENWQLAASLGFTRRSLFRFVEWPALVNGIGGIAALIFMLCATSFTIVLTLGGGPQATTLEVAIYQALKFDYDPPRAVALAGLQIALSIGAFLLLARFFSPQLPVHPVLKPVRRFDGATLAAKILDASIIGFFLIFIASPFFSILVAGLKSDLAVLLSEPTFLRALVTSLLVALIAGMSATVLTIAVVQCRYRLGSNRPLASALGFIPSAALLVPTLALATGWFMILQYFRLSERAGPILVVVINMLMAMPFTMRILEPAIIAHHHAHDRLAASLDITGLARLRVLDWPCLKAMVIAALSFGMALSMGDLGAIAIFGSDGFITLPALLAAKLGSYRSQDAAGIALILAFIALALARPASSRNALRQTA